MGRCMQRTGDTVGGSMLKLASLNSAASSARSRARPRRTDPLSSMVTIPHLLAAVDLASNSFRLIVGRVEETPAGSQIYQVDALREPVRLAAGLSPDKMLDRASQERAWSALKRFGERLRDFHPDHVRVVATNTLRVAKNAPEF